MCIIMGVQKLLGYLANVLSLRVLDVLPFCSACTMSSVRNFTFAISSPDEFLVLIYVIMFVLNHAKLCNI